MFRREEIYSLVCAADRGRVPFRLAGQRPLQSRAASGCGNAGLFANPLFGKTYLWTCTFPARSAQELSAPHPGVPGNAWHSSSQVLGEV